MDKELVEKVRLLKWADAKLEENLEMRVAGGIWNQAIDEVVAIIDMHEPEVVIKSIYGSSKWRDVIEMTEVYVDGESVEGWCTYGGQPEDNSRMRHYSWVEPLLKKLAERLGAKVVMIGEIEVNI